MTKVNGFKASSLGVAGLPLETKENIRPPTNYTPSLKPELLADYDYVKSGLAQIVDARDFREFGQGRIPQSISQDPARVLNGGKFRGADALSGVFSRLNKDNES